MPYVNQKTEHCCAHGCTKKATFVIVTKKNGHYKPFCDLHMYYWVTTWFTPKRKAISE